MSGKGKTHQRIIALMTYLNENTEPDIPININALQKYLGEFSAERQIIYNDLRQLELAGAGVSHDKNKHYYYDKNGFTYAELSLLGDVICSTSYLDAESAEKLLLHIRQMTNNDRFDTLAKQTKIYIRPRTLNSDCLKNIELIHNAVAANVMIEFDYAHYDSSGTLYYEYCNKSAGTYTKVKIIPSENGNEETTDTHILDKQKKFPHHYIVSPYSLVWDNSQCYLIANKVTNRKSNIRVFRADKIFRLKLTDTDITPIGSSSRFYSEITHGFDAEKFMRSVFSMYSSDGNKLTKVKFLVSDKLRGAMTDRFGQSIKCVSNGDAHFSFWADIQISDKFYGWAASFDPDDLAIISPPFVRNAFCAHLKKILEAYGESRE